MQQACAVRTRPTRGPGILFPDHRKLMQQVSGKRRGTFGRMCRRVCPVNGTGLTAGRAPGQISRSPRPGRAVRPFPIDRPPDRPDTAALTVKAPCPIQLPYRTTKSISSSATSAWALRAGARRGPRWPRRLDHPRIALVEPHPPGAGKVWRQRQRQRQPAELLTNTMTADNTVFPDASVRLDSPGETGRRHFSNGCA
ncbi:hypothetical protein E1265_03635 [Streptomyces sp. 8K308]|nr:hypothetical protein E1265_03635 [Streptomyces sp. 8K308]